MNRESQDSNIEIAVRFPPHLRRFINLPVDTSACGDTVREIVADLEIRYPGVSDYLIHENGELRQHVNIFLDDRMISDREALSDSTHQVNQIFVMQALSGG